MRSVVTGEAASWGRGQWLASPSWKRRRPKSWPPSWAECALWSFLYIKVIKKILLQKKKKKKWPCTFLFQPVWVQYLSYKFLREETHTQHRPAIDHPGQTGRVPSYEMSARGLLLPHRLGRCGVSQKRGSQVCAGELTSDSNSLFHNHRKPHLGAHHLPETVVITLYLVLWVF